jgi:hypothetical protein
LLYIVFWNITVCYTFILISIILCQKDKRATSGNLKEKPIFSVASRRPLGRTSGVPRNFFRGVHQIQLRTEGRENGDLGAVAP